MKTLTKTLTAVAAVLIVAGCTANAADTPNQTGPQGWQPGWRHEQMVKAWQDGTFQGPGPGMRGPMMMRAGWGGQGMGPGMGFGPGGGPGGGRGPGAGVGPGAGPGANVDPSTLPPWCPYRTQAPADAK
ncbi:MAG: hypothetical protein ACM31L_01200 [Actinomycetota bacterium]